ncbi:MAG TPA: VWA domain-containing protein, partial [Sumerlaeia bacterium]|nr:VWA domain-containing protein [Sumerlaeia bacterium]
RRNLLMYLQILILLLLVFALARPTMWLSRKRGLSRVILIDNTASMNATDGPEGATRLEEAKEKARALIQNMGEGDESMIVAFGGAARVVQPLTSEKAALNAALRRIEPTDARSRVREAILMAKGLIKTRKNAAITVVSDGGAGHLGSVLVEDDPVEFVRVGWSDDNCGIVAFDLRESFETRGQIQVFAEVENFSSKPVEALLRCLVDGRVLQAREEAVPAKSRAGFVFTGLEGGARQLLRLELDRDDLLAADNVVQGFVDLESHAEVLLVTNGNFFLERLLGLLPGARVSKIAPGKHDVSLNPDLVIFDGFAPEQIGPGNYLFINVAPPLEGFAVAEGPMKNQIALDWNRLHPVMRFVNLDNLVLAEGLRIKYPDWVVPLAESAEGPLILVGERRAVRVAVIAFDLYDTDWPMQVSFPIFLDNVVRWLAGRAEGSLSGNHLTGDAIVLPAGAEIRIVGPGGESWLRRPDENRLAYFDETHRVGIYRVEESAEGKDEKGGQFAVNLLSVQESDVAPKEELLSGEQVVVATTVSKENREIWGWFAALALLVLATEWHVYCRRAWL